MKEKAIELWREIHPDNDSYLRSKIGAIEKLDNVGDNFMTIIAMFDIWNARKLLAKLSDQTKGEVKKRLEGTDYIKLLNL